MLRLSFNTGSVASFVGLAVAAGGLAVAAGGLPVAAGRLPVAAVGLLCAAAGLLAANGFADPDVAVDFTDVAMNKTYNSQAFARLDCNIMKLLLAASQTASMTDFRAAGTAKA